MLIVESGVVANEKKQWIWRKVICVEYSNNFSDGERSAYALYFIWRQFHGTQQITLSIVLQHYRPMTKKYKKHWRDNMYDNYNQSLKLAYHAAANESTYFKPNSTSTNPKTIHFKCLLLLQTVNTRWLASELVVHIHSMYLKFICTGVHGKNAPDPVNRLIYVRTWWADVV